MIPSVVDWRITSACDMNCPFCYGPKGIRSMNREDAISTINLLHNMGVETICISGGEPLLHENIVEILKTINSKGMGIFLSTGGNLYLKYKDAIENYLTKLSLPLDGYSAEIHTLNGRTAENYQNVLSILEGYRNKDRSFQIKIATLLTSRNIAIEKNLIEIYNLLLNYSIDLWKIYELLPEGRGAKNYDALGYGADLFTHVTDSLNKKIAISPTFQIVLSRRTERDLGYFIIQPNGDVVIPKDDGIINEELMGNILEDPIETIISKWQSLVNYRNYLTNIRLAGSKPVLSELDRKILFELDRDPRQSLENLSKAIGYSEEATNNRIRFLFDKGIIKNIIPIANIDKLGFMVFLVNLTLGAVDKYSYRKIIDYLVENPNVAWVVRCSGRWTIMIAIFAKNPDQFTKLMMEIANACGEKLISYDTHIVSEKYVLGQRYLLIKDKRTDFIFDRSRICLDGDKSTKLTPEQYMILSKIRESREASVSYISKQLNIPLDDVERTVDRLQKNDVLKKFQPVYDVSLLGYEWYEVFIKFKNLTEQKRREFINYIHSIPEVVHINCTVGAWDLNFEVHAEDKKEFNDIYFDVKGKFKEIIWKEEFVRIYDEYKFSFLVDAVLEEGLKKP
jgi:DNA-binding Lrp family transcriptional regulator/MoaA/NifB/PqqE/SkfB family radical SAM enzyme